MAFQEDLDAIALYQQAEAKGLSIDPHYAQMPPTRS
jgi:hypothetical protein